MMGYFKVLTVPVFATALLAAGFAGSAAIAQGQAQICAKCLEQVQSRVVECEKKIPPEIEPKDPANPTSVEKAAAAKRMQLIQACAKEGQAGLAQCRKTAGCPQ